LLIYYGGATSSDHKSVLLNVTNLTNTSTRTFEFPDASGTLALTSNLSAYLPLTGGTLTGALSGTSATFSSSVTAATTAFTQNGGFIINYSGGSASSRSWRLANDIEAFADFAIQQSTTQTGSTYATKLYINPSGNVGIGTSSPTFALGGGLQVKGSSFTSVRVTGGSFTGLDVSQTDSTGDSYVYLRDNAALIFGTNNTERMRITSGGDVLIGATSIFNDGKVCISADATRVTIASKVSASTGAEHIRFINPNGVVGYISTSGTVTTYSITSDYRLKQDLKDYKGLELISAIKTYDYEWKADNSRMYGVMAHELAEVLPYAVSGEKDELDKDGNPKMQGVDYSKIVPIIVKSIQELEARIKQLENK
jgi:hypothetical protein